MSAYFHRSIEVSCRGVTKSITNLNHLTTVANVIHALLDDLGENDYFSVNDCCLYVEQRPYLLPLKTTDLIEDILDRYSPSNVHFKLAFKRNSSPSRLAQRKQLLRTASPPVTVINPYERLRIQELLIQKQQEIIQQLSKATDENRVSFPNGRQSRQDTYEQADNREETTRSLSRVRFRLSTVRRQQQEEMSSPSSSSSTEVKSILKKPPSERSSSVDRDIEQLLSLKPGENSFCTFEDDARSEKSTTDSCLGSLSSNDGVYHCSPLETLV